MQHHRNLQIPYGLADVCDPDRLALVVYDMQVGVVDQLADGPQVTERVGRVLGAARRAAVRVFFTRHMTLPVELMGISQLRMWMSWQRKDRVEDVVSPFLRDSPGFQLMPELRPRGSEAVFDKLSMSALYQFTKARYRVTVASPDGGRVEVDALSDPRDESRWSADDLISMGALNTPEIAALLDRTPKLADLDIDDYDALVVCGGQAPMFQFRDNEDLRRKIAAFYEAEKPTAALCHGVCALLEIELSDGSRLIDGKTITGFANVEEDFGDAAVGQRVQPFRIEDEARSRGANYVHAGLFKAFAIRDNQLITGQQQYSGTKVAQLVIESLGV